MNIKTKISLLVTFVLLILIYPAFLLTQKNLLNKQPPVNTSSFNPGDVIEEKKIPLSNLSSEPAKVSLGNGQLVVNVNNNNISPTTTANNQVIVAKLIANDSPATIARFDVSLTENGQPVNSEIKPIVQNLATNQPTYNLEYSIKNLGGEYLPSSMTFVWLNPETQKWERIPTTLDTQKGIISTTLNHFSSFGVDGLKAQVFSPTLKNWETDTYTGALTYSLPIETVPGLGGLNPNLSLSYNTNRLKSLTNEIINNAEIAGNQKGSWLGAGWDLTLPEVRFEKFNDPSCGDSLNPLGGAEYTLNIGGAGEDLAWVGLGNDNDGNGDYSLYISKNSQLEIKGYWATQANPYGTNWFYPCSPPSGDKNACSAQKHIVIKFVVFDSSGRKYTFDIKNSGNQFNASAANRTFQCDGVGDDRMYPSRYMVTNIEDPSGNTIDFTYQVPDFAKKPYNIDNLNRFHYFSTYPSEITYNKGKAKIVFEVEGKTYPPLFTDLKSWDIPRLNYELGRLKTIKVYSDFSSGILYRKYVLNYIDKGTKMTFCVHANNAGEGSNDPITNVDCTFQGPKELVFDTIKNVDVYAYGESNQNKLVPTDFTYQLRDKAMHFENGVAAPFIINVKNNYGGQVNIYYISFWSMDSTNNVWRSFDQNVVFKKEIIDSPPAGDPRPATPTITMLYSYDDFAPQDDVPVDGIPDDTDHQRLHIHHRGPNKGGGFGSVTVTDPITQISNTTFYYPYSPKNGFGDVGPEANPLYGKPLRQVSYKTDLKNPNTIQVLSDEYSLYGINPIKTANFDFLKLNGDPYLKLFDRGFVIPITIATEKFVPRNTTFLAGEYEHDRLNQGQLMPLYMEPAVYSSNSVIHTESRTWYDSFSRPVKQAIFADYPVANRQQIIDRSTKSSCAQKISGAHLFTSTHGRSKGRDEWFNGVIDKQGDGSYENCFEGANAWMFTFGLPFKFYYHFTKPNISDIYYFPETWTETGTIIGTPQNDSLKKFTYTKFLDDAKYLNKGFLSLPLESFVSETDADSFDNVTQNDRWQWSKNAYDEGSSQTKGLLTSKTMINTNIPSGRLDSPDTISTKTEHDQTGNPVKQIDTRGNFSTTSYSSPGKPYDNILPVSQTTQIKNPDGTVTVNSTTQTTYNNLWLPEITTDPNGAKSKAVFDCLGRLQEVYKPNPQTGEVSDIPSVNYFYFDYQAEGCGQGTVGNLPNLRTKTRLSSSSSDNIYSYSDQISDGMGNSRQSQILKTKIDGQDKALVSETYFNNRGLKEAQSLPTESTAILVDGSNPKPIYIPLSNPQKTTFTYDDLGRNILTTDALGNQTGNEYFGIITKTTDANNIDKQNGTSLYSQINALGQKVRTWTVNLPDSSSPSYGLASYSSYDVIGNLTQIINKKCQLPLCTGAEDELNKSQTLYDNLGRKWQVVDPDLGTWKFAYDANGNINKQIDNKNQTLTFEYDSLNRVVKKNYPGNPRAGLTAVRNFIQNIYDISDGQTVIGKRLKMLDSTGYSQFWYDKRGRVIKSLKSIDKQIVGESGEEKAESTSEYFDSDALKSETLPTGEKIEQKINDVGQLIGVKGTIEYLKESEPPLYNKFGTITKVKLGNNLESLYSYDLLGRTERICVGASCSTNTGKLMDYRYVGRDKTGNILGINNDVTSNSAFSLTYSYDNLYQLKSASGKYNASYDYDPSGNILKKSEGADTINMEYSDILHKHAPKVVNGVTYEYDANGNLTKDEERDYVWDFDNKPVKITMRKTNVVTEFAYDGDGNRVVKKVTGEIPVTPTPTPTTPLNPDLGRKTGWNLKTQGFPSDVLSTKCPVYSQKSDFWFPLILDYSSSIVRNGLPLYIKCQ